MRTGQDWTAFADSRTAFADSLIGTAFVDGLRSQTA